MNATKFIESAPLYTRYPIESFNAPKSIMRTCGSKECCQVTTWSLLDVERFDLKTTPQITTHTAGYECVKCENNSLEVIYELLEWSVSRDGHNYSHKAVRKVGQIPAPSMAIPYDLEVRLRASSQHYKNALVCRNHNLGIAAMAYIRRVINDHTDNLIDIVAAQLRSMALPEAEIAKVTAAKTQVRYEQKPDVASKAIPDSLQPGGVNPLGQLYVHTSSGLHSKSDEECVEIFDDLRADFEYIFLNIYKETQERREYAKRMKQRLNSGKS